MHPEEPYLTLLSLKQVENKTPEQMEGAELSLDFSQTASLSRGPSPLAPPSSPGSALLTRLSPPKGHLRVGMTGVLSPLAEVEAQEKGDFQHLRSASSRNKDLSETYSFPTVSVTGRVRGLEELPSWKFLCRWKHRPAGMRAPPPPPAPPTAMSLNQSLNLSSRWVHASYRMVAGGREPGAGLGRRGPTAGCQPPAQPCVCCLQR